MFSHGIYCTWGPISKYCENIKQDYICYDRSKTKGCFTFNLNKPGSARDMSNAWERLKNYNLNSSEIKKVDSYLVERELQKGDTYAYNFKRKEKNILALKKIKHK